MSKDITTSSLSPSRLELVKLIQQIFFGRLECLAIQNAEPLFDPTMLILREIKFGGENAPRSEHLATDFMLKQQVIELFDYFDEFQNGVIDALIIKNGLPFLVSVREGAAWTLG